VKEATASFTRAGMRKDSLNCSYFEAISASVGEGALSVFSGSATATRTRIFREETRNRSLAFVSGTRAPEERTPSSFRMMIDVRVPASYSGGQAVAFEDAAVQVFVDCPFAWNAGVGGDLALDLVVRGADAHLPGFRDEDPSLDQGVHRLFLQAERPRDLRRERGAVRLPVRPLEVGRRFGQLGHRDRLLAHGGGDVAVLLGICPHAPPDERQGDEPENDLDCP
jgi:hypothetical protein